MGKIFYFIKYKEKEIRNLFYEKNKLLLELIYNLIYCNHVKAENKKDLKTYCF
mgnify:CR=1 FL=1